MNDKVKNGLSKRELIAAMALQGMLSAEVDPVVAYHRTGDTNNLWGDAVKHADRLIAELNK